MWFRALRPYRLPSRLGIDAEELERRLQSRTFSACAPAQASSLGWVPALDDAASALVHRAGPYWMVRLKREEKPQELEALQRGSLELYMIIMNCI